jgi:CelD/BcsL family acetyltransferase involved in cellulose biosynthesis
MTVLAFRAGDVLVGILPAFIHLWKGCRRVTLVGNGITDYLGLTAQPEYASECARLALEWFWRSRHRWDLCDWQDLRVDSPLLGARFSELEMAAMPYLNGTAAPIGADPDAYGEGLPHGLRRTIRLATRRLERGGEIQFETLRSDHDASALRTLFRLHEERWRDKGGPESMLDSKSVQAFLIKATRRLSARGMIRLYTMRFRGQMAAMIYGIRDRDCLYGYITGMDPQLARYSVGSLLLNYAIRDAILDGARTWDFLRGEERYKVQWGAQKVPKRRVFLWHTRQFAPPVTGDKLSEAALV